MSVGGLAGPDFRVYISFAAVRESARMPGGEMPRGINTIIKANCLGKWDIGGFRAFMAIFHRLNSNI